MEWLYRLLDGLLVLILRVRYRVTYEGLENLPPRPVRNYLVACNHISMADPIFLAYHLKPWVRFMGKAELFQNPWIGWACYAVGGFPVARGTGDMSALEHGIDLYKSGYPLAIFPEGTRSKDGTPGRPKSGLALLAKTTGADILPCAVVYGEKKGFRTPLTVKYGRLIPHEELGLIGESPRELRRATKRIWNDILTLWGGEPDADHSDR